MKQKVTITLDPEEIKWAKEDAPRRNVSAYIGDLIRDAHMLARIPKIGVAQMFHDKIDAANEGFQSE